MRRVCLALGLAVLALVWGGPLLDAWRQSFAAHMLAHMGVVAIAAPLLAVGIGGKLPPTPTPNPSPQGGGEYRHHRFFMIAAPSDERIAKSPSALWGGVRGGGSGAFSSLPLIASLVELLVVWFWHAPAARAAAEASIPITALEQVSFLAAGLFLWTACLRAGAAGAFGLLVTSVHMTLLGALLSLSPRPLYGLGEVTCFGTVLPAAQDQQIGGVLMLLIGAAVYLAGGVALLGRLLGPDPTERRA